MSVRRVFVLVAYVIAVTEEQILAELMRRTAELMRLEVEWAERREVLECELDEWYAAACQQLEN